MSASRHVSRFSLHASGGAEPREACNEKRETNRVHLLRPVVFLDRDGTLNRAPLIDGVSRPPAGVDELEILPGVAEALERLRAADYRLIVATNQPDVARGDTPREEVERINAALRSALPIDEIMTCYHDDADGCGCRKPKPGLLIEAAQRFGLDLGRAFMIGDRWRDVGAGRAAGCRTILLRQPYSGDREKPDFEASSLSEAVAIVLGHSVEGGMHEAVRR